MTILTLAPAESAVLAWRPMPAYQATRCDDSPLVRSERMAVAVPWWAAQYMLLGALDRGHAAVDLQARLGLPAVVHDQQRLPMQRYGRVLRQLSRQMRDELVGLWRVPVPPGTFATVAAHMLHCSTLGEALRTGLRLYRLIAPGFPLHLRISDGQCWLQGHDPQDPSGGRDRKSIALHCATTYWVLSLARWLVDRQIPVLQACLASQRQDSRHMEPEPFFEVPARYGSAFTGLCFDAQWLRRPVLRQHASLRALLQASPPALMRRHTLTLSTLEQVRSHLRVLEERRLPSIEEVASRLGLSPRSLRRRLEGEGIAFRTLKDTLRRDLAMAWLADTEMSVTEIGDRLGFSDASAFHRGFKRWAGISPGQFRRTAGHAYRAPAC